ncbi:MAG: 30S ribosomal protein S3 [Bradymonadales bacterium]|nr:MAG: 30S ribosomal protein S3 [Bradymonadales bacterium]
MGQKIHPGGLRLKILKTWDSIWFAEKKSYGNLLAEDLRVRKFIDDKLSHAGVSKVVIERSSSKVRVSIHTSRPGIIIGKKGAGIDILKAQIQKLVSAELLLNIKEVRKAEVDAKLVAENIATQLERRVAFRRAMKKAIQSSMKFGAQGIKVMVAGRLGGADMARTERYHEGRVPLHTLRANIDYGTARAKTTYGIIGIKVWIFHGEVYEKKKEKDEAESLVA